jgi:hypothetical protein
LYAHAPARQGVRAPNTTRIVASNIMTSTNDTLEDDDNVHEPVQPRFAGVERTRALSSTLAPAFGAARLPAPAASMLSISHYQSNLGIDPTGERHAPPGPCSTDPFRKDVDFVDRGDIIACIDERCSRQPGRAALMSFGGFGCKISF